MNAAMTIEDFNAYLTSERDASLLQDVLRKLTKIERPEDVAAIAKAAPGPLATWQGWDLG